ncbi:MAG: threonine/serine dehydratase [Pseudomonadota bacterium]
MAPSIDELQKLALDLGDRIVRTPVVRCAPLEDAVGGAMRVMGKLEFLQRTGTFKARGALATLNSLSDAQKHAGVTAVSAGNHAIATAYAAQCSGVDAKLVMLSGASPVRRAAAESYGATVVLEDTVHEAFARAESIRERDGRFFVHPFEGPSIAAGTGTLGVELCEQDSEFEALIVPIGGGGLIAGVSNAVRQLRPDVTIYGVEPEGADSMARSFAAGEPAAIDKVDTIADSLGAPFALPYSFELTRRNVDKLCRVSEQALRDAMGILFHCQKMAVEPACAASTAALLGPLREELAGRRVMLVFCGSNTDWRTWSGQANLECRYVN